MDDSDGTASGGSASEFDYQDVGAGVDASGDSEGDDGPMVIYPPEVRKLPYIIMNRAELIERQLKCVKDAAELFEVALEESFMLLREHAWDLGRLQEAWFADEAKVRARCGINRSELVGPSSASSATCPICMTPCEGSVSLSCAHGFCRDCWTGYLHSQVDSGRGCVQARCPAHKCPRAVPPDFFREFCDRERQNKYEEWYIRTYVDENPIVKWCSNPSGCSYACEYPGVDNCEIRCVCNFVWCWSCGEESHRPADCATVRIWNVKNSAESENITWIRANTKSCPKCFKPIEKNRGCNHMICSKAGGCGHEFCWLCLGDWWVHGMSTGGYYQCNIYDKQTKDGSFADEETSRQKAKHALDRYMFYFERFVGHDRSMKMTVRQEVNIEPMVQTLHSKHGFDVIELQFLYDALKQVRACRRVLKWTYVYGYYFEDVGPEKNLFEHVQKNLEEKTDKLHEMLEIDLQVLFFNTDEPAPTTAEVHTKFRDFRSVVINFTLVTQKWLVKILADVGNPGRSLTTGSTEDNPPSDLTAVAGSASSASTGKGGCGSSAMASSGKGGCSSERAKGAGGRSSAAHAASR